MCPCASSLPQFGAVKTFDLQKPRPLGVGPQFWKKLDECLHLLALDQPRSPGNGRQTICRDCSINHCSRVVTTSGVYRCREGWRLVGSTCYHVNTTAQVTWHQARQLCGAARASLVSIHDQGAQERVERESLWFALDALRTWCEADVCSRKTK